MAALPLPDTDGSRAALLAAVCTALRQAEADLNALDRAIGDGDHGQNMVRAAAALEGVAGEVDDLSDGEALRKAGMAVAMGVGGASGPLYGSLLLAMGKALGERPLLTDWAGAFEAGVAAMAARGRSSEGEKTMLDVLTPVARALNAAAAGSTGAALDAMAGAAQGGFEASRLLRATRGRAAYVGDRSIGADDPGAASALLCVRVVVRHLAENI